MPCAYIEHGTFRLRIPFLNWGAEQTSQPRLQFYFKASQACTYRGYIGLYWGYIGGYIEIMEKKMETTRVLWGIMGYYGVL